MGVATSRERLREGYPKSRSSVGRMHGSNYLAAPRVPLHLLPVTHPKGVRLVVAHVRALPKRYVEDVHVGSILPMLVKALLSPMQASRAMQTLLAISILYIPIYHWRNDRSYYIIAHGESRGNRCCRFTSSE